MAQWKPIVLLLAGLCAACEPAPQQDAAPAAAGAQQAPAAPAGATLAQFPASRAGDAAALVGTLDVTDGCVAVMSGGQRLVIASTDPDVRYDGARGGLVLGDGSVVRPGAPLWLGGSTWAGGGELPWVTPPPASCGSAKIWVAHQFASTKPGG